MTLLPPDQTITARTLQQETFLLGTHEKRSRGLNEKHAIGVTVKISWIDTFGILHVHTTLETPIFEVENAFNHLIREQHVEIIPDIFKATQKAVEILNTVKQRFCDQALSLPDLITPPKGVK